MKFPHGITRRFVCSLVRQNFPPECEVAVNRQINIELKLCHEYLAMAYHFDSSDVALPGFFQFFRSASVEERSHAELLMQYMNKRGGQIILEAIPAPESKFDSPLEAMVKALELEKEVNQDLLNLHAIATNANDPHLSTFIEDNYLMEQVEAIKKLADYVTQIERSYRELGLYIFDTNLKPKVH